MEQDHRLQQLHFDFELQADMPAEELQNKLSHLTRKVLTRLMDKVFTKFSDPLYQVKIPELVLDLGSIPPDQLAEKIPPKLELALELALRNYFLKYPNYRAANGTTKQEHQLLSLLEFFLKNGSFPWWKPSSISISPGEMLQQLIEEEPQKLRHKISLLRQEEHVIQRLTQSFKAKDQAQLVALFFPRRSSKILTFARDFQLIYKNNKLKNLSQNAFRNMLWQSMFSYLLNQSENEFTEQQFVEKILADLSLKIGVEMGDWIEGMEKPAELSTSFVQLIHDLEEKEVIKVLQTTEKEMPNWLNILMLELRTPAQRTAKKILQFFLEHKQVPKLKSEDLKHLSLVLDKLLELYPAQAMNLVDALMADKSYREKSLQLFSTPLIKKSLRLKFPLLYVHLTNLSQDLLRLLKPYFQGESSLELEKKILNHYLIYFSIHEGKSFDIKELLKNTLIALAGPQQKSYVKLLKTIQSNFNKRGEGLYFESDLIQYLSLIYEEEGLDGFEEKEYELVEGSELLDWQNTALELDPFELVQTKEMLKDDLTIFSFYLERGALFVGLKLTDVREASIRLLKKEAVKLNAWFRRTASQEKVLTRMVDFFSTEMLVPLYNLIKPNLGDFGIKLKALLQSLTLSPKETKQGDKYFWKLFNKVVIEQVNEVFSPYQFTKQILHVIITTDSSNRQKAKDYLFALIHEEPKPKWFTAVFPVIGEQSKFQKMHHPETAKSSIPYPKKEIKMEEKVTEVFDAVYAVENAGLVILWPYLGMFFERAELMSQGEFLTEEARQKGVYLLEYLITGNEEISEHQLVLNKLFCAYELSKPLSVKFNMTKEWEELCVALLQGVIQNWPILGDISPEAFRESFLLRSGKLAFRKDKWHLQVETKAFDVLMKSLPWGIAIVNLSWQEKIINVDWG